MQNPNQALLAELKHEAASTRRMFERVPFDNAEYQPHQKSTRMNRLAGHVSELFGWIPMVLATDELDFASGQYQPFIPTSRDELLQHFDQAIAAAGEALSKADSATMAATWTMRAGDHVIVSVPKAVALRSVVFNHLIHHRGQLSVYLRLNNAPVPGMYGPSADEH